MPTLEMVNSSTGDLIDKGTGELFPKGVLVWIPQRPKIKEQWFMSFQEGLATLAKCKEIRGEPRAILDYLMAKLDFENYIKVRQVDIAKDLDMYKSNVSKHMKLLGALGIITKGPEGTYKLNPVYGWKGRLKNYQKHVTTQLRLAIDNSVKAKQTEQQ